MLLGDPSNPAIDAEELQRLCSAGPEMSEAEYRTYMQGVRAILVEEWARCGETPEAVDAMLASEERSRCVGVQRDGEDVVGVETRPPTPSLSVSVETSS